MTKLEIILAKNGISVLNIAEIAELSEKEIISQISGQKPLNFKFASVLIDHFKIDPSIVTGNRRR